MSFSNSELQQLKSILADQIREVEGDRAFSKECIGNIVKQKQPFKQAGLKSKVDQLNDLIREQYKDVDKAEKKLAKLRKLQASVKRELAENKEDARFSSSLMKTLDNPPAPNEALVAAMDRFKTPVHVGYVQMVPGQEWQDKKLEALSQFTFPKYTEADFKQLPTHESQRVAAPFKPYYTTLELRTDGLGNPVPNRIINPGFNTDPVLDSRWYTVRQTRPTTWPLG